jgi:hypothetical protein
MTTTSSNKKISPTAYQALREALPVIFWNRRPFEGFLRAALRDHPELLGGLDFNDIKRNTADILIDRLAEKEGKYQHVTLDLMVEVASMDRFQNLEQQPDADVRVATAKAAVAELRRWTERYSALVAEKERVQAEWDASRDKAATRRQLSAGLDRLHKDFLDLQALSDHQQRGRLFQGFLDRLLWMFDLEPRLEYSLPHEQIDGSLTFDTDDYILEARWRKEPVSRDAADVFDAKVRRKGKNALGLLISLNGLSADARAQYSERTSFLLFDGVDLITVLEDRVRLDDLLRRKKRHANETGNCSFPASQMLSE